MFRARPSGPLLQVANGHIWFFTERDWSQECCHGNNKIGGQCKICIIQKREYLQNGKRYAKKENAIFLYSEKPFKQAAIMFYFVVTLIHCFRGNVPCGTRWVVPNGQDTILPARLANYSAGFDSSCPLTEPAI